MSNIVYPPIEDFLRSLVPQRDGRLKEMEELARAENIPIVPPETAQFLYFLTRAHRVKNVLEIGTAIGYSTIWLACGAAQQKGHVTTIEIDSRRIPQATENFARVGLDNIITVINGDALEVLTGIDDEFDMIFIDAAKNQYMDFFGECFRLLKPGGLMVADNVLFRGLVADATKAERKYQIKAKNLKEFLWLMASHPDLESTVIPIGDGLSLAVKKR